ncbi:MAG: N-acetylmuramoyl-L-alanine amidase, partial [Lachnospiraceae bacterium]|nr:N-acetylmuramoyl-L-alanine amidase [Lachnospiraceae bacterium]
MKPYILIDNGHGSNTLGKCSPDKKLLEYQWARDVAKRIASKLQAQGYAVHLIVPETTNVSLKVRTQRVNQLCGQHGTKNCLLVSVHINAAGADGKWHTATGWSGWVAPNASSNSKRLAQLLYAEAKKAGLQGNRAVPACAYWVGNFAIVRDTKCPAVLTENLFMDNQQECQYLLSEQGKETLADLHVT